MRRLSDPDYLGEFEQVVLLAIAALDAEAYGMAIRREIASRTLRDVSIGAVYATIERLLDKGYLRAVAKEQGKARRFYSLAPEGVRVLEISRDLQARMWKGINLQKAGRRG